MRWLEMMRESHWMTVSTLELETELKGDMVWPECTRSAGPLHTLSPVWGAELSENHAQPQLPPWYGSYWNVMGSGNADLVTQVVSLHSLGKAGCMCIVQQAALIFCTCAGESRSRRNTCWSAHLLKSLAPEQLFWSPWTQLMLGLTGLPQVSRSCLPMWVTWQLFLTASVTKGNATSVTRLTSAGHLHCHLQLHSVARIVPSRLGQWRDFSCFPPSLLKRVLDTRKTQLCPLIWQKVFLLHNK